MVSSLIVSDLSLLCATEEQYLEIWKTGADVIVGSSTITMGMFFDIVGVDGSLLRVFDEFIRLSALFTCFRFVMSVSNFAI